MSNYTWLIGALLAATGSILSNLGVNCQKYSFMHNAKLPKAEQKKHIRQKGWLFGMLLVVLGSLGDFSALSLAAQSIVAPIGSITLVANVFFAHYWLKEHIGWVEIAGTSMIVLGSVTAVAFGDHSDTAYDIHAILRFFYGTTFIVYAVLSAALGTALYRFQLPITPIKQKIVDATKRYELAYDANDRAQMEYEDFYIASLTKAYIRWEKVHPFSICALSGILGGQSVMFGKMVSEMINVTASGDNQLLSPLFYLFIGCMLACVVGQLQYLAIALSFFDALYVVPVFQCFFIAFSTLGGASFFSEFSAFSAVQAAMFPLGLLTTLGGVVVLTRRKMAGPGDRLKRLVGEEEGGEQRASDEMSPIEEEDEDALREEEDDALTSTADSTTRGENEVLKMEQRRLKKERRKRRRLKKAGYEGLGDEDEDAALSLSETDTESEEEEEEKEEEVDEEDVDFVRKFTIAPITPLADAKKPLPDEVRLDQPHASPKRQSPIRRVTQTPPSSGLTGTPPSESPRRIITPLPNIDDLMGSGSATSGVAPTPAVVRRGSLREPITVERRSSLERRQSLPRRPSRSPGPLVISDDGTPPSSAPSTPSSLQRLPSLFMSGGAGSPAAGSLMQPSLSQYMPPPTGMDLWTKGEPVNDKVKKYSSVAHHAGGLVGVPIVSAIAHAYAIAREEREEEKAEAKQREHERREEEQKAQLHNAAGDVSDPALSTHDSDDGASAVEMEVLHPLHPTTPVMASVTLPIAEAVVPPPTTGEGGGYAGQHHGHQGSIYGRLKGRLMHAMGGKGGSAQMETAALTEEGGGEGNEEGKAEGKDTAETADSGEVAVIEEPGDDGAEERKQAGGEGGAGELEQLNKPSVDDTGPSDAEHEELRPDDVDTGATEPPGL